MIIFACQVASVVYVARAVLLRVDYTKLSIAPSKKMIFFHNTEDKRINLWHQWGQTGHNLIKKVSRLVYYCYHSVPNTSTEPHRYKFYRFKVILFREDRSEQGILKYTFKIRISATRRRNCYLPATEEGGHGSYQYVCRN